MKILFAFLSYLFGAIPTGYIFYFLSEKKDIRNSGSQATGATNVFRLKGMAHALPVLILDIFKGFLPVFLAFKLFPDKNFALVCAFLTIIGHCFPVYIKFRGGKGVATTIGVYAAIAFKPLLCIIIIFLLIVAISRYVSLGSLLAALSYPFFVILFKGNIEIVYLSLAIFLLILAKHQSNIRRLIKGNERKLGEKIQ